MADETTETVPAMDYAEHNRTYAGFMEYSKFTVVAVLNVILTLLLVGVADAFWFGILLLVLTLLAAAMGIVMNGSYKPSAGVTAIGVFLFLFSIM